MNTPPNREVSLFTAALELPLEQRAAYLDQVCADDPALRQHLEDLLGVPEQAVAFLENPAPVGQASPLGPENRISTLRALNLPTEKAGDRIGRYRLLQQIGEGGCGVVYMAEQEEPVRRRVALKVIKLGMDTKRVVARFEAERQVLALMDHPNIAKVLDAGATQTGRPYFVMELVRGIKITEYCDEENLSTEQRLNLFIQVCQAVQHAHQKGIIHRDLKPSNIMVADHDGLPVPKVIDFGVAKATTDQRLTDKTLFTAFEQFIGTPAYMSPEQARLSGLDIDTRTDIYSLGVLLYELLTGKTPLDQEELLASDLDEMRRTIREVEPVKPSTRLTRELRSKSKIQNPKTRIGDDLDWIVMKALEKDRARRYETANGLARDVQHYLADEPVVARPPSRRYRFQKLARRNKLAFAATGAVAAALVIGLAASTWEYFKKRKAEKQARAIHKFLTEDLLFQATPEKNAREKNVTMVEVLNVATSNLDHNAEIAQQPELEAALRLDIGTTYQMLGILGEAKRNLRRAFGLRRSTLGPQDLETLAAEQTLAEFLEDSVGEYAQAEVLFREAWLGRQRRLGAQHLDTLASLEGLEDVMFQTGRPAEAERIARQILPIRERLLGRDAFATIDGLRNLAAAVGARGDHAQAERLMREALDRCQRTGASQELYFLLVKNIAFERFLQGDAHEATRLLTAAVPQADKRFGPDHPSTQILQRLLARSLADEAHFAEAEALASATLEARRRQATDPPGTGRTLLVLGRSLVEQGKLDEAKPFLTEALTIFREHVPTKDALVAQAANWLGAIQLARGAYPEAESLLLPQSDQFFSPAAQMSPNELRLAIGHIVELYQALSKPEQTAYWQKKLDSLRPTVAN